jgi:hypothetical protein
MESQIAYAEQMKEKAYLAEVNFFRKLENTKTNRISNYEGKSVSHFMNIKRDNYELLNEVYLNNFNYAPHVSNSMVYAYCGEHNIGFSFNKGDLISEYASIVAHQKISESGLKEPSIEIICDSVKQALCFQALRKAENIVDLSNEKIQQLSAKAKILAEHLNSKNMHILNDKKIMHEAFSIIKDRDNPEIETFASRIAFLSREDFLKEKQLQKIEDPQQTKSRSFGIEM